MTTSQPQILTLAERLKLYWSLLDTAVRLDCTWSAHLSIRLQEAERDALALGRRAIAAERRVDSLADLREAMVENIVATMPCIDTLATGHCLPDRMCRVVVPAVTEVAEIVTLLTQGVDVRRCQCTALRESRNRLAGWLAGQDRAAGLIDSPRELTKLACAEAGRRMSACAIACLDHAEAEPAAARLH